MSLGTLFPLGGLSLSYELFEVQIRLPSRAGITDNNSKYSILGICMHMTICPSSRTTDAAVTSRYRLRWGLYLEFANRHFFGPSRLLKQGYIKTRVVGRTRNRSGKTVQVVLGLRQNSRKL